MLTTVRLPEFATPFASASLIAKHVAPGDAVKVGSALFDLKVDFSGGMTYDCAPISFYRLVMREAGWVRHLKFEIGQEIPADSLVALIATTPDDPAEGQPVRAARVTVASILHPDGLWGEP